MKTKSNMTVKPKLKSIYYKIKPIGDEKGCIVTAHEFSETLSDWLQGINIGEELVVSRVIMSVKKFNKLNEYEG